MKTVAVAVTTIFVAYFNFAKEPKVADPATTTINGCTCKSVCSASIGDFFVEDWCKVDGECGKYSFLRGNWDYCLYKSDAIPDFTELDWKTKQDFLWSKIIEDESLGEYHTLDALKTSMKTPFENEWDILTAGRRKAVHGVGAVCPFTISISDNSTFTGLLKASKTISGLIRLGPAGKLPGLKPGISIKILRTGTMSATILALTLDTPAPLPNNNHNFFAQFLSNQLNDKIEGLLERTGAARFCTTGHCITKTGLSHLCTHDQNGIEDLTPVFPYRIFFDPADIQFPETEPTSIEEFMEQFKEIPVGSKLFKVRTLRNPDDTEGLVLGDLITTDQCHTSKFGDTRLAFKHQWIEEDAALKPEWKEKYAENCYCNPP